jgi:cytochrome c-type biogenesis protein CcmH/NrfG
VPPRPHNLRTQSPFAPPLPVLPPSSPTKPSTPIPHPTHQPPKPQEHHRLAAALKADIHHLGNDLAAWDAPARARAAAALMHAADISNAAKPARESVEWARRVTEGARP